MTRRTGYAVLAAVAAVIGVAALVAGTLVAMSFGKDGRLQSTSTRLVGSGAAIIGDGIEADARNVGLPDGLGTLTLDVTPEGSNALFVGTARPTDVDSYLAGVPYDVVTDLPAGGTASVRAVPGDALPPAAAGQSFWLTSKAGLPGKTVSLSSELGSGTTLVVTNADPALGVNARIVVTLTVAWAWRAAMIMLGIGAGLVVLAVLLVWRSHAAGMRMGAHAATRQAAHSHQLIGATVLPGHPGSPGAGLPPDPGPAVALPPQSEPAPTVAVESSPASPTAGA